MLIIGAKGHAIEIFQCLPISEHASLVFYDDIDDNLMRVFNSFPVCKNTESAIRHFEHDSRFILGLGNPKLRKSLDVAFSNIGGKLTSIIAETAQVSSHSQLGDGLNIMNFCLVAPNTVIGRGTLLNASSAVHHDVQIGEFCEISPSARLLGRCRIGARVSVGAGAVILPDIKIGNDSIIGAGAVVTRDLSANSKVVGVPARSL